MLTPKDVEIRLTTPDGKGASNLAELIFRNGRGYLLKGKQAGTVYVHANYKGVETVKTINIFDPYN